MINDDSPRNTAVGDGYSPPAPQTPAAVPFVIVHLQMSVVRTKFKPIN